MNKKTAIIAIIVLAIVAVFVLRKNTPAPIIIENTGGEVTTKEQKNYKSDKFGFSFSYPEDYILSEKEVGDSNRRYTAIILIHKDDAAPRENGEGPTAITIDVYPNLMEQTVLDWLTFSNQSNYNLKKAPYTSLTIGSLPAITYKWSGLYEGKTVAFNYEDFIVALNVTYFAETDQILKDFEKVRNSFSFQKRNFTKEEVLKYLSANISSLSPAKEMVGGKFYVTDFEFMGRTSGRVFYEDGHNAYVAKVSLSRDSAQKVKATLQIEE